jgi:hypothetical protein
VVFDAANSEWMLAAALATSSGGDFTVLAVYEQSSLGANQWLLPGFMPDHEAGGLSYISSADLGGTRDLTLATTRPQLAEWHFDAAATSATVYRDGSAIGSFTGTTPGDIAAGQGYLGTFVGVPGTENFDGVLSELIFYDRKLTAPEIAAVRAYMATRYAIAFGPLSVADLELWLPADSSAVTLNGADVAGWADASGNSADASSIGSRQPAYVNDGTGQNGYPYADMIAANNESLIGSLSAPVTSTEFFVMAVLDQSAASVGVVFGTPAANLPAVAHVSNTGVGRLGGFDNAHRMVAGTSTGVGLYGWQWTNSGTNVLEVFVDGVSKGTVATEPITPRQLGQDYSIGDLQYAHGTWSLTSRIYELLVYGRALTAEEQASLETLQIAKFAL